jgi:hypothetical protein
MDMPNVATPVRRAESREDELARLIREQREDRRQDRTGLRSTLAQEVLGAPDLFADVRRVVATATRGYVPRRRRRSPSSR